MDAATRAAVVAMIFEGHTNTAIRDALGVRVNQVAGVRQRDFPRMMTQAEARALALRQNTEKGRRTADVVFALLFLREGALRELAEALAIPKETVRLALKRLSGRVERRLQGKHFIYSAKRTALMARRG